MLIASRVGAAIWRRISSTFLQRHPRFETKIPPGSVNQKKR
jgi:hypothetical protein